jgi:membrane protein YdbS with pleckstrin-like domain
MERLHPGAKWLFRVKAYFSMIFLILVLGFYFFSAVTILALTTRNFIVLVIPILIGIVLFFSISEAYSRLAYKNWKYELTPREIKLERGIIWKRYSTIPYERVQNVDISRGILARMIGFSTLDIQTAGYHYSGRGGAVSEGHIPAVSVQKAEKIREFLIKKIGKRQGL